MTRLGHWARKRGDGLLVLAFLIICALFSLRSLEELLPNILNPPQFPHIFQLMRIPLPITGGSAVEQYHCPHFLALPALGVPDLCSGASTTQILVFDMYPVWCCECTDYGYVPPYLCNLGLSKLV